MLWILLAIQELTTLIVIECLSFGAIIALPIIKIIIIIVLIVCTCRLKTETSTRFDGVIELIRSKPLLQELDPIVKDGKSNERIYVEFRKNFEMLKIKGGFEYIFEIAVYTFGKYEKITKS
jgi:hypothetical protein